jgi:hypothetical protein
MAQRTSILIDTDSWIAGVLDAGGRFDLWKSGVQTCGAGGRWTWRVTIVMNEAAASKFELITKVKLRRLSDMRWSIPAAKVMPLLTRAIPRMFCLHEEAGVVYRYLITKQGRRGMRKATSEAVEAYRQEMLMRLAERKGRA